MSTPNRKEKVIVSSEQVAAQFAGGMGRATGAAQDVPWLLSIVTWYSEPSDIVTTRPFFSVGTPAS